MNNQKFLTESQARFAKRHGAVSVRAMHKQGASQEKYEATFLKDKNLGMTCENFVKFRNADNMLEFLGL